MTLSLDLTECSPEFQHIFTLTLTYALTVTLYPQEEHPEDAVLDTTGAQAHVYANLRVTTPPTERPLQKRPHSDFVTREAAKEAAGLKGTDEKSGTLS